MSLLDSDAEELKKNNTGDGAKSGRKVNQSGLGALRGLSKYSNLTAKYRTTGKSEPEIAKPQTAETQESVEHSRGTSAKSVQSQCKVSATNETTTPTEPTSEVSAKSVQSQCDNIAPTLNDEKVEHTPNIESQCKVGAKSVQPVELQTPTKLDDQTTTVNIEVSAKSVQVNEVNTLPDSIVAETKDNNDSSKSVQSQCDNNAAVDFIEVDGIEVSAKSVQVDVSIVEPAVSNLHEDNLEVSAKSVQSQCATTPESVVEPEQIVVEVKDSSPCEVSAKSVQSECAAEVPVVAVVKENDLKVSAKSVQSPGKVSADAFALNGLFGKPKVSAKSVQSGGAKENTPPVGNKDKVSAKSVQSRGKVSATEIGDTEASLNVKSKVITKNLDLKEPTESVISIAGSQKVIVDFLFQLCLWNNSLITPPITKQQLVAETGLLEETALSSIKRLRNKHIIDRYAYKDGKAGWTQYQFSETSYKELVHLRQVGAKSVQPSIPMIPREFAPVVHLEKKMPAPVVENKPEAAEASWFKNLDFTKVQPIGPMVVNATIRALVHEKLTPEIVQDFINRFTSWTSTQGRITSPIGLFCDKLKELAKEGDSPIFGCMTDEEREIEAAFALQVEKAKAELDLIRKAKSVNAEREVEAEFESWYVSSSETEKQQYAEPSAFAPANSEAYKRILRAAYFEKMNLKD